jgi:DNA replication protein DnaC
LSRERSDILGMMSDLKLYGMKAAIDEIVTTAVKRQHEPQRVVGDLNRDLVRDLAGGGFLTQQRNVVLVGGTGTGKSHRAIAIARSCIRTGTRGRFFNTVDLVTSRTLLVRS